MNSKIFNITFMYQGYKLTLECQGNTKISTKYLISLQDQSILQKCFHLQELKSKEKK